MLNSVFHEAHDSSIMHPFIERGCTFNTATTYDENKHFPASSSGIPGETNYVHWCDQTNIQNDTISQNGRKSSRISTNCLSPNNRPRPSLAAIEAEGKLAELPSRQPNDEERITFSLRKIRFIDDEDSCTKDIPLKANTENASNFREAYLASQMKTLEEKIQKAACIELHYLQSLEDVMQRHIRCEEKLRKAVSRRPQGNDGTSSTVLESYISEANKKIAKSIKIETAYKRRVKQFHDKRYRWSKLYENAGRELLELDPSRVISPLPPLFTLTF